MVKRKVLPSKLYKEVLERDGYQCQKCGKGEKLELHHIIPIAVFEMNAIENLITLCRSCHSEWEHVVYPNVRDVSFEEWLELPTCPELIAIFTNKEMLKNNDSMTFKEMRRSVVHAHRVWRTSFSDEIGHNIREVTGMSHADLYKMRKSFAPVQQEKKDA